MILTGHSQGGTRAALVSMWRKKKFAETIPAYTFAGTGVQCAVRGALPKAYSDDVDVTVAHAQITQYVHALDPYGWIDHQPPGTQICSYGTKVGYLQSRITFTTQHLAIRTTIT